MFDPDLTQVLGPLTGTAAWSTVLDGSRALFRPAPRQALRGCKSACPSPNPP